MKLKLIIRLAIVISVVLLCTGFGVYSFFRLNAEEHRQDFDLYSLVPQDVVAVLETDHLGEFVSSIDQMKCSRDGRFLYASNRLQGDGIAIFSIDQATGELTKVGYQLTGIHPRNFLITPDGKFLLCACRDSDLTQIFSIDPETGLLTDTGRSIASSKPVCLKFRP